MTQLTQCTTMPRTTLKTFVYSTIDDHMTADALLRLRYGPNLEHMPIAWRRTMRQAAIEARTKIHALLSHS